MPKGEKIAQLGPDTAIYPLIHHLNDRQQFAGYDAHVHHAGQQVGNESSTGDRHFGPTSVRLGRRRIGRVLLCVSGRAWDETYIPVSEALDIVIEGAEHGLEGALARAQAEAQERRHVRQCDPLINGVRALNHRFQAEEWHIYATRQRAKPSTSAVSSVKHSGVPRGGRS